VKTVFFQWLELQCLCLTPCWRYWATIYQNGDVGSAEISYGLKAGVNVSSDEAFEARVSADIEVHFGGPSKTMDKNKVAELPVINALSSGPNYCADHAR
jgi:hypothetical protein